MTDEEIEKIIKRNMSLQMNLAGVRADFEEALRKPFIGLTDEEIAKVVSLAGFAPDWVEAHIATQIVRVLEAKLKEKNA